MEKGDASRPFLNLKRRHMYHFMKMLIELKDNVSELKDSIGEDFVTITPKMYHRVILSVRHRLHL